MYLIIKNCFKVLWTSIKNSQYLIFLLNVRKKYVQQKNLIIKSYEISEKHRDKMFV